MSSKARGLGRGLDALLGTGNKGAKVEEPAPGDVLKTLPIDQLQAGRYQPRRTEGSPGAATGSTGCRPSQRRSC